jgi:hypothetical protein
MKTVEFLKLGAPPDRDSAGSPQTKLTDTRFVIITHNPITMARMG